MEKNPAENMNPPGIISALGELSNPDGALLWVLLPNAMIVGTAIRVGSLPQYFKGDCNVRALTKYSMFARGASEDAWALEYSVIVDLEAIGMIGCKVYTGGLCFQLHHLVVNVKDILAWGDACVTDHILPRVEER